MPDPDCTDMLNISPAKESRNFLFYTFSAIFIFLKNQVNIFPMKVIFWIVVKGVFF